MKITGFWLSLLIVTLWACKNDKKALSELSGHWEVSQAEFNGQPAPFLERIHFDFAGNQLTTNFNEATTDQTAEFELKDKEITQKTTPIVKFTIETADDTSMALLTQMRGYDFRLMLKRNTPPQ
jgi:hypothetical protein